MQVTFSRILCSRYLFYISLICFVLISEGDISISSHHMCTQWTNGAWGRRWMLVWNGPVTLHRRQDVFCRRRCLSNIVSTGRRQLNWRKGTNSSYKRNVPWPWRVGDQLRVCGSIFLVRLTINYTPPFAARLLGNPLVRCYVTIFYRQRVWGITNWCPLFLRKPHLLSLLPTQPRITSPPQPSRHSLPPSRSRYCLYLSSSYTLVVR